MEMLGARRRQLDVRLNGWLGAIEKRLDDVLSALSMLREREFYLRFNAAQSRYQMDEPREALAAELCLDAGTAFGRLQGTITSQLKIPFEHDGKTEDMPISMVRNFCFDGDPAVRERAYHAELAGWASIRTTVAACLNGVKGTAATLAKQRGRAAVLDAALDQNRIDRATLDAMLGAIREYFPVFRRYLDSKAKKLGRETLPWWDLFAPLGGAERRFTWDEARAFIVEKFGKFSPALAAFADRAFEERWIDAGPRVGKRGGAYCMGVPGIEESRILANYDGSFEQLMTLAHELGHAYHNECQKGLAMSLRGTPSTLAETASIFCETLTAEAALVEASPAERLMILEAQLGNATQVCVDISSRYLFETAVFAKRPQGELSADEFCDLMKACASRNLRPGRRSDDLSPVYVALETALLWARRQFL
ncbi:MAG: M3 family metallopeptidase [Pirellulales bacterium]